MKPLWISTGLMVLPGSYFLIQVGGLNLLMQTAAALSLVSGIVCIVWWLQDML